EDRDGAVDGVEDGDRVTAASHGDPDPGGALPPDDVRVDPGADDVADAGELVVDDVADEGDVHRDGVVAGALPDGDGRPAATAGEHPHEGEHDHDGAGTGDDPQGRRGDVEAAGELDVRGGRVPDGGQDARADDDAHHDGDEAEDEEDDPVEGPVALGHASVPFS